MAPSGTANQTTASGVYFTCRVLVSVGAYAAEPTDHIRSAFLIESTTLSIAGGGLGIIVGVGTAMMMVRFYGWNTLIVPESILVSFGFAALVGIFFGLYPARKAARLDPIESLRYE